VLIASSIKALITLMVEAESSSEMSVDIDLTTRQYIPEDSELHIRRRENLKSHKSKAVPLPPCRRQGGKECSSYSFLTLALDGGEKSASGPDRDLPTIPIG